MSLVEKARRLQTKQRVLEIQTQLLVLLNYLRRKHLIKRGMHARLGCIRRETGRITVNTQKVLRA